MAVTGKAVEQVLSLGVTSEASDIHITADAIAAIRVNGQLVEASSSALSAAEIQMWLKNYLDANDFKKLEDQGDIDFAFQDKKGVRFRVSAYYTKARLALAIRILNSTIPSFDDLNVPSVMRTWSNRQNGLVIVTGPTGSGKSTTLATLVNAANQTKALHIATIEDPIEYIIPEGLGVVHQREIGLDAFDFVRATRAALREDIDILVLGEMRDQETISAALTVAETGHLVFATLHTPSAAQAVDRIIDAFDPAEQPLIRSRLSSTLVGVAYQRLLPTTDGKRMAAFEILVGNSAIKNLIREGKTFQIPNAMTTSRSEGMINMNHAIEELISSGKIDAAVGAEFLKQNI
jgi:twitching motility protein PilT